MKNALKKVFAIILALVCVLSSVSFSTLAAATPSVDIIAHNLSFRDNVYLMYAVSASNVDAKDVKVLIWLASQDEYTYGTQADVISYTETRNVGGFDCLIFNYTKLTARQMGDYVYARAYANVGGTAYYSDVEKYSILEYAYNKLGKTGTATSNQKLITLLNDMLQYGASAQDYADYKTDRLVTDDYYEVSLTDATLPDGFQKGLYLEGETVAISAPLTNNTKDFYRWEDANGNFVNGDWALQKALTVGTKNLSVVASYVNASKGLEFSTNEDGTCGLAGLGDCTDTDVVIPRYSPDGDLVTGIEASAFVGEKITSIKIPLSLTEIAKKAFNNCAKLTDVYYEGTAEEWEENMTVASYNTAVTNATFHGAELPKYTVTFVDYDGTELKTEQVTKGQSATAPEDPTRDGYTFDGWDKEYDEITENMTVTATYTAQESTDPATQMHGLSARAGDTVSIPVSVKNNPGFLTLALQIDYDSDVLTLTKVANGASFSDYNFTAPKNKSGGCKAAWFASDLPDTIENDVIMTLTFTVSSQAATGAYSVTVSCPNDGSTLDGNNDAFVFNSSTCNVTVQ